MEKIVILTISPSSMLTRTDRCILEIVDYLSRNLFKVYLITPKGGDIKGNFVHMPIGNCSVDQFLHKRNLIDVIIHQLDYTFNALIQIFKIKPSLIISMGSGNVYLNPFVSMLAIG